MSGDGLGAKIAALEGSWDLLADSETAGILAAMVAGREDDLSVRFHPWLKAGTVIAVRRDAWRPAATREHGTGWYDGLPFQRIAPAFGPTAMPLQQPGSAS